ncbi:30S ribosomal protein S17 [Candidatus Microgenomates bacterium]|jgi:small subunit ribosomal protein S17|nr:MAG: 30S ribosomal protein S17 [Candidatus Microgenomates bacterium]
MKTFEGQVVSDKMVKAAVVLIERRFRHPMYGKIVKKNRKIHAVNEIGAKEGETVVIAETRPVSKTISFKIIEIINSKKEEPKKEVSAKAKAKKAEGEKK